MCEGSSRKRGRLYSVNRFFFINYQTSRVRLRPNARPHFWETLFTAYHTVKSHTGGGGEGVTRSGRGAVAFDTFQRRNFCHSVAPSAQPHTVNLANSQQLPTLNILSCNYTTVCLGWLYLRRYVLHTATLCMQIYITKYIYTSTVI